MSKETILAGLIGLLIGILAAPFFLPFGYYNLTMRYGPMMNWRGGPYGPGGSMMMGDIDRHFIEEMVLHHEDAISMAEIALRRAEHQEIKTLAENIKRTQSDENAKMREWYKTWYGTDVPTDNDGVSFVPNAHAHTGRMGFHGGMMGDDTDVERLETATPFDKAFIEKMIPHHQMATMMAHMLLNATNRSEMRTLANDIITAQSKEIEDMRTWYRTWYGRG